MKVLLILHGILLSQPEVNTLSNSTENSTLKNSYLLFQLFQFYQTQLDSVINRTNEEYWNLYNDLHNVFIKYLNSDHMQWQAQQGRKLKMLQMNVSQLLASSIFCFLNLLDKFFLLSYRKSFFNFTSEDYPPKLVICSTSMFPQVPFDKHFLGIIRKY